MHFREHPPPHFHADYGEHQAMIEIETLRVLRGSLPQRVLSLVLEWAHIYRENLLDNWAKARKRDVLSPIPPLE